MAVNTDQGYAMAQAQGSPQEERSWCSAIPCAAKCHFCTGYTGYTATPTYCKLHHCRPITDPHWSHVPSPRTFVQHLVSRMISADPLGKFSPEWSPRREAASPSASPRSGGHSQSLQRGCSTTRFIGLCCSHGARRINARP